MYTQVYVAYSKLFVGKLFKGKSKTHTVSAEKQHKISKVANYQNIILRNNSAF